MCIGHPPSGVVHRLAERDGASRAMENPALLGGQAKQMPRGTRGENRQSIAESLRQVHSIVLDGPHQLVPHGLQFRLEPQHFRFEPHRLVPQQ